jgi:glycosyltransferase involved in cell wall biosynthesis
VIDSVLVFTRSIPHHHKGGMETQAWSLAAEWAKLGVSVHMVTTAVPGLPVKFTEDGIDVTALPETKPGKYSTAWWAQSAAHWQSLAAAPSVVFSVSAGAYSVAAHRSHHPLVPFFLQAHGTAYTELRAKLRTPTLRSLATAPKTAMAMLKDLSSYRDFDEVIAVGEKVADAFRSKPHSWSVDSQQIRLIANAVRLETYRFDPAARGKLRSMMGYTDEMIVVGCVGRIHNQKRLDRALQAAAVLKTQGHGDRYRFMIVGQGPHEQQLRNLARSLGVQDMVQFAGGVHHNDVGGYLSASDISILPTGATEAGVPLSVLEALAAGLPCIITAGSAKSGDLLPILHECETDDATAFADAITGTVLSPSQRECLLPPEYLLGHCANTYLSAFADRIARLNG